MRGAILALFVLGAAGWFFWQQEDDHRAPQAMNAWQTVDTARATRVEIRNNAEEPVILTRQGEQWMLGGAKPADGQAVQRLLDDLARMRPTRVVTRKREHDAELGLDAKGTHIVLKDAGGETLFDAIIGKQGANLVSTYLRLQGQDVVYAMDKALVWQVRRPARGWEKVNQTPVATKAKPGDPYASTQETKSKGHAPERQSDGNSKASSAGETP